GRRQHADIPARVGPARLRRPRQRDDRGRAGAAAVTAAARDAIAGFDHGALFYSGDDDFLAGTTAFVREGLAEDAVVVTAEPPSRLDLLRHALGADVGLR